MADDDKQTSMIASTLAALPESSITVYALKALDFVVPGEWQNIRDLDTMIKHATGEADPAKIGAIAARAGELFADENEGYRRALWIYQMTDKADAALGAAAMANKIGERIELLSFLNRFTPQADTTQAIDLSLKIVAELLSFCFIHGVPRDRTGIGRFAAALKDSYRHESVMRMAALVCIDGLIPLGPDFVGKVAGILESSKEAEFAENPMFGTVQNLIPAQAEGGKLGFIKQSYQGIRGWMDNLLQKRGLTVEQVTSSLKRYIEFTDDKLDYVAAFLDLSTSYYTHTGAQSVVRYAILRAADELYPKPKPAKAEEEEVKQEPAALPPAEAFAVAPLAVAAESKKVPAEARYDYLATAAGHLSFSQGETLELHGEAHSGWTKATNDKGQSGWVPSSYVKPLEAAAPKPKGHGPRVGVMTEGCQSGPFSVSAGDQVTITGEEKDGWLWATNAGGMSGWISAKRVQLS